MLPLKHLLASAVDINKVLSCAPRQHVKALRVVKEVMDGSHQCWNRALSQPFVNGPSSNLTAAHIADLERWKVVKEVPRSDILRVSRFFLVPKSCLRYSRPILDAREVNSLVDRACLPDQARFRLLPPAVVARLVFSPRRGPPEDVRLSVLDARSWFTSLSWGEPCMRLHGFRVGSRYYKHIAPTQGSTLLPWVAQTITLAISGAPPTNAPFSAFVAAGIAVTYDDILVVDRRARLEDRYNKIQSRMALVGGQFSKLVPPTRAVEYCGVEYDLDRGWRMKTSWTEAFLADRWPRIRDGRVPDPLAVLAGCAVWVCNALVVPLIHVVHLIHGVSSPSELSWLLQLVRANPWRSMHSFVHSPPEDCDVIVFDGSLKGGGWVDAAGEHARPWSDAPRPPHLQQQCEWEALILALRAAGSSPTPLLVVGDNLGVLQSFARGLSTTPSGSVCIKEAAARSRHVFTAWVPSECNEADRASRATVSFDVPCALQLNLSEVRARAVEVMWTASSPLDLP